VFLGRGEARRPLRKGGKTVLGEKVVRREGLSRFPWKAGFLRKETEEKEMVKKLRGVLVERRRGVKRG